MLLQTIPGHEFWLKDYPTRGKNQSVYRVALGELIEATERKTFPPGWKSPDHGNKSGSIGFMDLTIREQFVPKEGASPYRNHEYLMRDCERVRTLTILTIGIEQKYWGKGYARLLKQRAEEITREWGLDTIVADMIENPIMRDFNVRRGYQLYDGTLRAVKRLKAT
ncbi:GNAT family N-acetyltransferase [Candidatus Woesearchaeota archaeon]|nr:GNAT family N-acetyltransferase [Candidatus Woesearchaeota archaeon]